ncbi:hypothetical protein BB8028_0012g00060 [Beauveria bassiana]|uniref:Uncharacterized protein n=2 Tax=Beauveria bassiana TaxID=176275 RepID=A0A2N6ND11_BEABA|nr:uncharacterized protein BBA_09453 [Beauveria bassiana ARSEF 2860]EJP61610.1 hypothetical protein BBA_09453 [Beauveria bassiana ARSEF 2860]PMB65136.1 hypothetical protein BM221_008492 [Beauveria bassiana]PQK18109.1 hypothetical protein BB8028_0012g00060 [Beauveria bassiana]
MDEPQQENSRLCEQFAAFITQSNAQLQHEREQSEARLHHVSVYAEEQRRQLEARVKEWETLQTEVQQLRSDKQVLTNVITYLQREMRTQRCWLEDLRQQLVTQNQIIRMMSRSSRRASLTSPSLPLIHHEEPLQEQSQQAELNL